MKKRRHHHVWQHYLKSWAVDGRIYCLKDGRIFATGTTTVAVERHFHKLHKLNPDDIALIRTLVIDHGDPTAKKPHENFLMFNTVPTLFEGKTAEIEEGIDIYRNNVLEDYHAGIEASFLPLLDRILKDDIGFYSKDEECKNFLHFICTQYMRTKGIKFKTIEQLKQKCGIDMTRSWGILSQMLAVNIGASLFCERRKRKLVLVHNHTDATFITGDQPIINLDSDRPQPLTTLSLYYPISPRLALLLPEVDEEPAFSTRSLAPAHVSALNAKMLEACHSQAFGHSEASLVPVDGLATADSLGPAR